MRGEPIVGWTFICVLCWAEYGGCWVLAVALEGHRVFGCEGPSESVAQALAVLRAVRRTCSSCTALQ